MGVWASNAAGAMQICYCYSKRRNTGGGGREATFSLEYFIQNKDLVVKQTNLNDAPRERLGFGQEKLASVPAIYKNQSQPKHSSGLASANS